MTIDIEKELDALIEREGGHVNDPNDAGGETIWGITVAVARASGYSGPMRAMPIGVAKAIYRKRYWSGPNFDAVAAMSPAIAAELFDTGVNMGPSVAASWLQRWLNALNRGGRDYRDMPVDGAIGPLTISCLQSFLRIRGEAGEQVLLRGLNCSQGHRYLELAEARPANENFLFGWVNGRVA